MEKRERRTVLFDSLEVRAGKDGEPTKIVGHAAVFNQRTELFPGFSELVAPGAFTQAIQEDDVRALWNHDANIVVGRAKPGRDTNTLRMKEDATGLAIEINAPETQLIRDMVLTPIQRGDVDGMSFGFSPRKLADGSYGHTVFRDGKGNVMRTLTNVRLFDVSPVAFPAYAGTDVSMRAADLEELLEEFRRGPEASVDGDEWKAWLERRRAELELELARI